MAQRFAKAGKVALLVLFCLAISISVLITGKQFTASHLAEKAVEPTNQYLSFVFGRASFPTIFTGDEASHMRDVAWLLRSAALLAVLSGLALVWVIKKEEIYSISKLSLGVFAGMGIIAALVPFDALFRAFHLLFFPQGNWTFPFDSTLIQFYPQEFFAWYALCWFCYAVLTAAFFALFSRAIVE